MITKKLKQIGSSLVILSLAVSLVACGNNAALNFSAGSNPSMTGSFSTAGNAELDIEEEPAARASDDEEARLNEQRDELGLDESGLETVKGSFSDCYAYNVMDSSYRELYAEIYVIIFNQAEEVLISTTDVDALKYVFQCIINDHPEIYWVSGYYYVRHETAEGETKYLTFTGNYTHTLEERDYFDNLIEQAVNECLSGVSMFDEPYKKVKYVYEYLVNNTEYVPGASDNQNIISVFVNHESVCQGYAKAMQYLLEKLSIECTLVTGYATGGEGHAWNLVNINGAYYYVDVTWGDADYIIEGDEDIVIPVDYDFLNITTEELEKTHVIDNIVPMPECISTSENYYVKEGCWFESYDAVQMSAAFNYAYANRQSVVCIKCSDAAVFQEIYDALITNQEVFNYLIATTTNVTYTFSEESLSFTFLI